ncbi:CRISPR-associated endonuclease Cas2 [Alphaproteobacteria bacterium HT1-32]|nr:CRISPR-associated endonuclease Cas2 [Alphaproteobacteria bacterium HT1-32]
MVFFDLPVTEPSERKAYTRFRNYLLDEGFEQAQFSVYVRHTSGKEAVEALVRRIEQQVPEKGKIDILQFTDKQYENIISFRGRGQKTSPENPSQYVLF